jgi:hypothetical protein
VGDGAGAKVVVPSTSRNSVEAPDSDEDAVDLGDMVSGVSVQQDKAWLLGLSRDDVSLGSLEGLGIAWAARSESRNDAANSVRCVGWGRCCWGLPLISSCDGPRQPATRAIVALCTKQSSHAFAKRNGNGGL